MIQHDGEQCLVGTLHERFDEAFVIIVTDIVEQKHRQLVDLSLKGTCKYIDTIVQTPIQQKLSGKN